MVKQRSKETNEKKEIKHRVDRLSRAVRDGQIEKAKNFKDYSIALSKLDNRLEQLEAKKISINEEIEEAKSLKAQLIEARKALGDEHEVVVTEHAMLRYVERFMDVDMEEVYSQVLKLPKKDVTKYGNTIVTVYPVEGEHPYAELGEIE